MITLLIPPGGDQLIRTSRMLATELGTASCIKSPTNRKSVITAITSAQQKLKLFKRVPENGLAIFCGLVQTQEGKLRKVNADVEPLKPISRSMYKCDNRFHTEELEQQLRSEERFGFIIVDGNGCFLATLQGTTKTLLHKFSESLPKKHGRGGQSANRFARLGQEARQNYIKKVAEAANGIFISHGKEVNVDGVILGGSADIKHVLEASEHFDQKLKQVILKRVDLAHGGNVGFNQAIELSKDVLNKASIVKEKHVLQEYFHLVYHDNTKVCFGIKATMKALEFGSAERIIVFEDFQCDRIVTTLDGNDEIIVFRNQGKEEDLKVIETMPLLDWLVETAPTLGTKLELVSDRSQEGAQFVRGFGGIGAFLRYPMEAFEDEDQDDVDDVDVDQYEAEGIAEFLRN